MSLPPMPLLTGDTEQDFANLYDYVQKLDPLFANIAGYGIDPSLGNTGAGALTIVDTVTDITYAPGVDVTTDNRLYGFIDITFTKPDRTVDVLVYYKAIADGQFKQSYASTSPFRLISLKPGEMYQLQLAGQAANGDIGPVSILTEVDVPVGSLPVTPLGFFVLGQYEGYSVSWNTSVGFALLEYQLQIADDIDFTTNVLTFIIYGNYFFYSVGSISTTKWFRVRAVNTIGVSSAYTDPQSATSLNVPDGSIGTLQLADSGVTLDKMADIGAGHILGRESGSTGRPEEILLGALLQMNSTTLEAVTDTGWSTATGTRKAVATGDTLAQTIDNLGTLVSVLLARGILSA